MVVFSPIKTSKRNQLFIWVQYHTLPSFHMLILHLVHGGGYPQYILIKAVKLDNDHKTIESKFYPLYNKILNYWFPATEGYNVSPQWFIPNSRSFDSTIPFVIEYQQHPMLLLEIMPPSDFHLKSAWECAIIQIIQHFDEIGPTNQHVEHLYAISMIGKRWKAVYVTKGKGSKDGWPVGGIAEVNSLKSPAEDCWNPDITSDASWIALQKIVNQIKDYIV